MEQVELGKTYNGVSIFILMQEMLEIVIGKDTNNRSWRRFARI